MADIAFEETNAFAVNLKEIMLQKGITQAMLAKDLGVSKSAVAAWCRGTKLPNTDFIKTIAKYLGVSKKELLESKAPKQTEAAAEKPCAVSDDMLKAALFGEGSNATDEQLEDVKSFARFILYNDKNKGIHYFGMF